MSGSSRSGAGPAGEYSRCAGGQEEIVSQRIEDARHADTSNSSPSPQCVKASGCAHRRHQPDPVRYMSVDHRQGPHLAHELLPGQTRTGTACRPAGRLFPQLRWHHPASSAAAAGSRIRPTHSPLTIADGLRNRSLCTQKLVTLFRVTSSDLGERVAGVGFEPT
jgi:hypothetical protein